jgi:hypothetical protein
MDHNLVKVMPKQNDLDGSSQRVLKKEKQRRNSDRQKDMGRSTITKGSFNSLSRNLCVI